MKKKQIANLVMVAIILVIVAAGVLTVGHIRGWFDTDNGTYVVLRDMRGVIHLERDGVSYPVEEETVLRAGDKLSCDPGATALIQAGDDTFTIGEKAVLTITDPTANRFSGELLSGEMFANCENAAVIAFAGKQTELSGATALISVRAGAQSISILRGQVGNGAAGQLLNYVGEEETAQKLDIHSLNDFGIAQIRQYGGAESLCFTADELDALMAERQQALQDIINSQTQPTTTDPKQTDPTVGTTAPSGTQPTGTMPTKPSAPATGTQAPKTEPTAPTQATDLPETTALPTLGKPTEAPATEKATEPPVTEKPTEAPVTEKPTAPPTTAPETTPSAPAGASCTITIRCDTILNNMDDLTPGKAEFVPADGVILAPVTVEFESGESAFDVLKRVCDIAGIQLEYSWNPIYDSYYIEGINNLYEFDCGSGSGWAYLVNDWSPNYGCSAYTVEDGDVIVWAFSCQGLGTDVGAPEWTG